MTGLGVKEFFEAVDASRDEYEKSVLYLLSFLTHSHLFAPETTSLTLKELVLLAKNLYEKQRRTR